MKVLLVLGMILFLTGLLTGVAIPVFENPRMGLSAHMAGVQNGIVLLILGLMWQHVNLGENARRWCLRLGVYGLYAIWLSLFLAAVFGTSSATPIAGAGHAGSSTEELVVNAILYSGSVSLIVAVVMVIAGLLRESGRAA